MTNKMVDTADQPAATTQILSDEELGAVDGGGAPFPISGIMGLLPPAISTAATNLVPFITGPGPAGPAVITSNPADGTST